MSNMDNNQNNIKIPDEQLKKVVSGIVGDRLSEAMVRKITHEVVKQTLTSLGVDCSDPYDMQRDFQFIRDFRLASEKIKTRGLLVIIGIVITGLAAAFWLGLKQLITN